MKSESRWNWLKWLIIFCFTTANGFCGTSLEQDVKSGIIKLYNLESEDVEIELRNRRLDFDETINYDSLSFNPLTRTEPRGLMSFKVTAFRQGQELTSDQIRVKISYFQEVLVTTDRIGRRDNITPDKITLKRMEITSLTDRPLTSEDNLSGIWALKRIKKGQILTTSLIEMIPPILNGQGVSIHYNSGPLEISARGTAMEDGHIGEKIRIKNNQSRKTIVCTVIDDESVQIID